MEVGFGLGWLEKRDISDTVTPENVKSIEL
jgi:hypothetical protein